MEETFRQPFPTFREHTENLSLNYYKVASIIYMANLSGSVEKSEQMMANSNFRYGKAIPDFTPKIVV